jgi:Ca2+/Na+ antiporter
MTNKNIFYIFGILQAITLGLIIFFILQTTNIGRDTNIVLSVLFPIYTLIVEYMIYSER